MVCSPSSCFAALLAGALVWRTGRRLSFASRLLSWPIPRKLGPGEDAVAAVHWDAPPVFISGCNRGGTSILSLPLSCHPGLSSVGRGRHHEALWIWEKRFHDASRHRWACEPWLSTMRKAAEDATPDVAAFFHGAYARACKGPRMLEKTPANAVRIPFIDRLYPDCYVLHVLRDGRHTAASLMARGVKMPHAAQQWVGVHSIALPDVEKLGPARGRVVRFEHLLASPVETLLRICRHCRLDDGPAAEAALAGAVKRHLEQPRNRWAAIPLPERRQILEAIGGLQSRLGYPVEE